MSKLVTTKNPFFWLVVLTGVVLPSFTLDSTARAVVSILVVLFVVTVLVRTRRLARQNLRR